MIGFLFNISLYICGLILLGSANFYSAMTLNLESHHQVIALILLSPVIMWGELFAYNYLFEGAEIIASKLVQNLNEQSDPLAKGTKQSVYKTRVRLMSHDALDAH